MSDRSQSKIDDTTIGIFAAFFIITGIFVLAWDEHEMQPINKFPIGGKSEAPQARRLPAGLTPYSIATPSLIPSPLRIFRRNREPVQSPGLPTTSHRSSIDAESNLPRPARAWLSRFVPPLYRHSASSSASGDNIRDSAFTDRLTSLGPQPFFKRSDPDHVPTIDELETRFARSGLRQSDPLALPPLTDSSRRGEPVRAASSSSSRGSGRAQAPRQSAVDWRERKSIDSETHNNKWWRLELLSPRRDQSSSSSVSTRAWNVGCAFSSNTAAAIMPSFLRRKRHVAPSDAPSGPGMKPAAPPKDRIKHAEASPSKAKPKKPTPLTAEALASGDIAISGPELTPGSRKRIHRKYSSTTAAGPGATAATASGIDLDRGLRGTFSDTALEAGSPGPTVSDTSSNGSLYDEPHHDPSVGTASGSAPGSKDKGKARADRPLPKLQTLQPRVYGGQYSAGANPGSSGSIASPPSAAVAGRIVLPSPQSAGSVGRESIGIALGSPRVHVAPNLGPSRVGESSKISSTTTATGTGTNSEKLLAKGKGRAKEESKCKGRRPSEDITDQRLNRFSRLSTVQEEARSASIREASSQIGRAEKKNGESQKGKSRDGSNTGDGEVEVMVRRGAVSAASGSGSGGNVAQMASRDEGDGEVEQKDKRRGKGKKRASEMSCFNHHPGDRVKSP